jgi:FtsZ-binding cell division protein ZapB
MTEVEQLQDEIEKLKAKNYELVGEKRKAKSDGEAAMAELEQAQKERDEAKAELHRVTVELPRQNMLEEIAMPNMADTLFREITHHYDIGEDNALIDKATGEALEVEIPDKGERVPVKLDPDGIKRLWECKLVPSIGGMIRGSGATGGGAAGGVRTPIQTEKSPENKAPQGRRFGLN